MPIFVSRFSSARTSVANFRALQTRDDDDDDIRTRRGGTGRQERVRGGQGEDGPVWPVGNPLSRPAR